MLHPEKTGVHCMAFTTWTALLADLKNDMASGMWRMKRYQIDDREMEYRSFADFMSFFREVEHRAALENQSTAAPIGRAYARGGSSW
jgi:hypothetical protein